MYIVLIRMVSCVYSFVPNGVECGEDLGGWVSGGFIAGNCHLPRETP